MKKLLLLLLLMSFFTQAQEFGTDDLRVSDCGGDGNINSDAWDSNVTYNSATDQYLVVWEADDTDFAGVVDNELEIIGQIIDANGVEVGTDFMISSHQGAGDASIDANDPRVTYNSTDNEFLVVYSADRIAGEDEIYGVRLNASGSIIGSSFKISDMGTDGDVNIDATFPDVAYNSTDNEYLVVWRGDDLVDNQDEIWGQRISNTGVEIGANDFRISNVTSVNAGYDAATPVISWNSSGNEYLVAWRSDNIISGEEEIWGQRISNTGTELNTDFRISNLGTDGDGAFDAFDPEITYNATNNEYLVVWEGDRISGEEEIWGQRISNTGIEIGVDFRISSQGTDGDTTIDAYDPDVVWRSSTNTYFVVWEGDTTTVGEEEIWMQELTDAGGLTGGVIQISNMGTPGNTNIDAGDPAITTNSDQGLLITWESDDDGAPLLDNEMEIRLQMYGSAVLDVATNNLMASETNIYPNPNNGHFVLTYTGNTKLNQLTILDITGKHIQSVSLKDFNTRKVININSLGKGIYFAKITSENAVITKKIIVE